MDGQDGRLCLKEFYDTILIFVSLSRFHARKVYISANISLVSSFIVGTSAV